MHNNKQFVKVLSTNFSIYKFTKFIIIECGPSKSVTCEKDHSLGFPSPSHC